MEALFEQRGVCIMDGGTGTEMQKLQQWVDSPLWSALPMCDAEGRQMLRKIHLDYLQAGADMIITDSYKLSTELLEGTREKLPEAVARHAHRDGCEAVARHLSQLAVQIACDAVHDYIDWVHMGESPCEAEVEAPVCQACDSHVYQRSPTNRMARPLVAASLGPFGGTTFATGQAYSGKLYDHVTYKDIYSCHLRRVRHLMSHPKSQPDVMLAETISNLTETRALCHIFSELAIPGLICWTLSDAETVGAETRLVDCVQSCLNPMLKRRPFAIGVNCTRPRYVLQAARIMRREGWVGEICLYPNSGEVWDFREGHREWVKDAEVPGADEEGTLQNILQTCYEECQVRMVGGCCRVTPLDIRSLASTFDRMLSTRDPAVL